MSYTDPQSVTINGVATSLPNVDRSIGEGRYKSSDTLVGMSVRHRQLAKSRVLHQVQLTQQILAASPLEPAVNMLNGLSVTISVNVPAPGYISTTTQKYLVDALLAWCTASSGAKITQLLGGES